MAKNIYLLKNDNLMKNAGYFIRRRRHARTVVLIYPSYLICGMTLLQRLRKIYFAYIYITNLRICGALRAPKRSLAIEKHVYYRVRIGEFRVNCYLIRLYYPAVIFSSLPDAIRAQ